MCNENKEKKIDIILQTIDRYWSQAIQNENQRANFTNYILLIIGASQGYIIQREFDNFSLLLSIVIIVLSSFGAIVTAKYYERFREQASRVGRLMEKLYEIEPEINLGEIEDIALTKHQAKHPILLKIRLNKLWLIFYSFLLVLGILDLIIIVFGCYSK